MPKIAGGFSAWESPFRIEDALIQIHRVLVRECFNGIKRGVGFSKSIVEIILTKFACHFRRDRGK